MHDIVTSKLLLDGQCIIFYCIYLLLVILIKYLNFNFKPTKDSITILVQITTGNI